MPAKKTPRTSAALRDVLFDEIEELRGPKADPQKSLAVANIAKQIVNIAKVELQFHQATNDLEAKGGKPMELGHLQLGS